jgi:meiotically up-regulated gene 157 (Mug157) protein
MAYVARAAARHEHELGIADLALGEHADETLRAVHRHFAVDGPFGPQWSYDTDARGHGSLYHDANDVPTALAPLWGLVAADEPRWRNTMRFAWSTHNPGHVAGGYGGLGSRHTAGVWPLGDAQEWAVSRALGDADREVSVTTRLAAVASADGMLPETYDEDDGSWRARPWFAWPGSLVGLLHETFDRSRGPWLRAP